MNINKLFFTFKKKLLCENMIKSLLFALMLGSASVFIVSLVYHLQIKETPVMVAGLAGCGIFAISFLLFFTLRYPTKKKVASRMDELGLLERVSTMLEYRNVNTDIALMQRRDAVEQIGKISAKQMQFRFFKREFILCAVSVGMAVLMLALPYNVFAFGESSDSTNAEQEQIVKELIAQLREEVKESELDDELKDSLNEMIDNLEEDLKETDSELQQAAKINQAKKAMEELLDKLLTKNQIGEALQKYELTRALGEAISDGDREKVSSSLDNLEEALDKNNTFVAELSETIATALMASGVDTTDELYVALNDFSTVLIGIDLESDNFTEILTSAFDSAETAILAALEKQAVIEAEKEKLEDAMSEAKDEVLGNEKEEQSEEELSNKEGEQPEGEQQEGEKPEGEAPNGEQAEGETADVKQQEGEGSGGQGDGTGEANIMTEGIYDPVSGSVSYGEVFAAYYAEYLAAQEAGEVPEDLQEIMDQYFSSLN